MVADEPLITAHSPIEGTVQGVDNDKSKISFAAEVVAAQDVAGVVIDERLAGRAALLLHADCNFAAILRSRVAEQVLIALW